MAEGDREVGEALPDEKDMLRGGPEDLDQGEAGDGDKDKGGGPAKIETTELTIGGQTFHVPKDAADALTVEQQRFEDARDSLQGQIDELGARGDEDDGNLRGPDYSELIFTDPNEAVAQITKDVTESVTASVEAKGAATRKQEKFWATFYKTNPELEDYAGTVRVVMEENWAELRKFQSPRAGERLADLTKTHITGIVKQFGGGKGRGNATETLEGGSRKPSTKVAKTSEEEDDTTPRSLTAGIKARRKAQRTANARAA